MKRPWMPLYIADYKADTGHLSAAEHGAYLLLIMHYWQAGRLPNDDDKLARIASMLPAEWQGARETIAALFGPGWRHKRIEREIEEAQRKYEARVAAGRKGADVRWSDDGNANGKRMANACQPQPPSEKKIDRGVAPDREPLISKEAFELAEAYRIATGVDKDDPRWVGLPYTAQIWITRGYKREIILATGANVAARQGDRPVAYHAAAIERAHEPRLPLPPAQIVKTGGSNGDFRKGGDAADWRARQDDRHAAKPTPRLRRNRRRRRRGWRRKPWTASSRGV